MVFHQIKFLSVVSLCLSLAFADLSHSSSLSALQTSLTQTSHFPTYPIKTSTTIPPSPVATPLEAPEPPSRIGPNFLGPFPQVLQAFQFKTYTGNDFNVQGYSSHALCWYPVSGNYGTLPRILLYFTLVFAVLARTQEWLIAGALTAGLTYSGTAAVHACFLLWSGNAFGELDALGLYAILSSSCLVIVPLLNWSSTLRNLGRIGLRKEPTRAIILYWSFLVGLGYLSTFIMFGGEGHTTKWGLYTWSGIENITCTPPGGSLNMTAGQAPAWTDLVLDAEWIQENNCDNPCSSSFSRNPVFRTNSDLQLPTRHEREFLDSWFFRIQFAHSPERNDIKGLKFFHYITFGIWSVVTILAQGTYTVCFGRRTPAQARGRFYKFLRAKRCGVRLAQCLATYCYLWAVIMLILCPVVFLLNLTTIELYLNNFPESDPLIHVGAWSSWAATALVLIAALISRYHEDASNAFTKLKKQVKYRARRCMEVIRFQKAPLPSRSIHLTKPRVMDDCTEESYRSLLLAFLHVLNRTILYNVKLAFCAITFLNKEYQMLVVFWQDPEDTSLHSPIYSAEADEDDDNNIDLSHHIHSEHRYHHSKDSNENDEQKPYTRSMTFNSPYGTGDLDHETSLSRSTTLTFSRTATTETLVDTSSSWEPVPKHDLLKYRTLGGSPPPSPLPSLPPPVPAVPERVLSRNYSFYHD